jgi:hypothetical protein
VIGFILFRKKSLVCKDALHKESTIHKYFRDSALVTSQKNRFPVSRLDDISSRLDARQIKNHPSIRRVFPPGPFTVSRSFCASFHPSGRLISPSERRPVIDQLQILIPSSNKGRLMQPSGRHGFPSRRSHT